MLLGGCESVPDDYGPGDDDNQTHDCEHLGGKAVSVGGGALHAASLWHHAGVDNPDTKQPESFWSALEVVHRSFCDGCETTEEETVKVCSLLATVDPREYL
jgi:hypothetical protein